jgi:hypothetical protein
MMASSDFSSSIWTFQQPSEFGHILNNCNQKSSKGDHTGVCDQFTSSTQKVAARVVLKLNSTEETLASSDFSLSI